MSGQEREELLATIRQEIRSGSLVVPACLPPDRWCEFSGFARSTFDRWLADSRSGLVDGPEPPVLRPNGPGGKVLVHVARMQVWLDRRTSRRSAGRPRPRSESGVQQETSHDSGEE